LLLRATKVNYHDPDGLYNLGVFYYYNGKFQQAHDFFRKLQVLSKGYRTKEISKRLSMLEQIISP
jgi:hypothetical protein